jgi:hypothetical protein
VNPGLTGHVSDVAGHAGSHPTVSSPIPFGGIMSESTDTTTTIDAEQFAQFQAFQAKQAADKAKAEAAKVARKRANNRPLDASGEEMPAGQSYVKIQADYLAAVLDVYQNDPDSLVRSLTDVLLPTMQRVAHAPRLAQASTYDQERKVILAGSPPEGTLPVPTPKSGK